MLRLEPATGFTISAQLSNSKNVTEADVSQKLIDRLISTNGSQSKNPDISDAIFTLSLSILILNSQCVEGARDVRVLKLTPITFKILFELREYSILQFHENRFIGKRYQTFQSAHIVEHQDTANPSYYPLVFNAETYSRNISNHSKINLPAFRNIIFEFIKSFMITLRYRRRNNATVIKVFINDEPIEAVDITSLISEEAFHIRYSESGQDKGWLSFIRRLRCTFH